MAVTPQQTVSVYYMENERKLAQRNMFDYVFWAR